MVSIISRNWTANHPTPTTKSPDAIRVGLFGASWIAPQAIITPAKSHPDVIIAAIAARDLKRAQAYAKKHDIPTAYGSYEEILADPTITAVYIPLPNGFHYKWSIRALRAGKHVLVEKPFVSNTHEATSLFKIHSSLPPPTPVLLEAFHYLFHPAWQTFLSLLSRSSITSVYVSLSAPAYVFPKTDIRFSYVLSGGATMDMGCYAISILLQVFSCLPEECTSATPRLMPKSCDQQAEQAMKASYRFPGGAVADIDVDLAKSKLGGLPAIEFPKVVVRHGEITVEGNNLKAEASETHSRARTVTYHNFILPVIWHRIDIVDECAVYAADGKVVRKWVVEKSLKFYSWDDVKKLKTGGVEENDTDSGKAMNGEKHWSTYRYMLEEFVNKIKGRGGSGVWVDGQDSINVMKVIDQTYEKCGLPIRPTSDIE